MRAKTYVLVVVVFGIFAFSDQLEDFSYNAFEPATYNIIENNQLTQLIEIVNTEEMSCAILVNDKPSVRSEIQDNLMYLLGNGLYKSEVFLMRFNSSGVDIISGKSNELLNKLFEDPFVDEGENTIGNAYFAILKAVRALPYNGTIMLFTDNNVGDKQLLPLVVKELISKNIKLYIVWIDSNLDNLNKIALMSGGDIFNNVLLTNNTIGYFKNEVVINDVNITGIRAYTFSLEENSKYIRISVSGSLKSAEIELEGKIIDLLNQKELDNYPGSFVLSSEDKNIIILNPEANSVSICRLSVAANTRAIISVSVKSTILNLHRPNNSNKLGRLTQSEIQRINTVLPPLTIEIGTGSELLMVPGKVGIIYYAVTNNDNQPLSVEFTCKDEKKLLYRLQPLWARIDPKQTVVLTLTVTTKSNDQSGYYDTITLMANGNAKAEKIAYLYVNSEKPLDVENPHLWYTFTSDCLNVVTTDCSSGSFALEIFAQDSETGLQELSTNPKGIYFPNNFISGTKDQVLGYYTASCCKSELQITAVDLYGNRRILEVNAYRDATLSVGSICAISLGVILLIVIIAVCIYLICKRCKSKGSVHLPTYRAPSSSRNVH